MSQKRKSSCCHHSVTCVPNTEHKRTEILHTGRHHHLAFLAGKIWRQKIQNAIEFRGLQPSGQGYKAGTNPWCAVRRCTDKGQDWPYTCHEHHIHEHTNLLPLKKKSITLSLHPALSAFTLRVLWYKHSCTRWKPQHISRWMIIGHSTKYIIVALIRSLYIFWCLHQSVCSRSPSEAKGLIQNNVPKLET